MTNERIEIITSVERRRRWRVAERRQLVAATLEPEAGVSAVSKRKKPLRVIVRVI